MRRLRERSFVTYVLKDIIREKTMDTHSKKNNCGKKEGNEEFLFIAS
jgi:hypothetical protein